MKIIVDFPGLFVYIICTIKMEIYAHEYMRAPAGPCEKLWPAAADRRWISTFF